MITDNISTSASESEFCAASRFNHVTDAADSAVAGGCHGDDDAQTSSVVHPVFYVFVVAQLFVGFGGCGTLVLSFPYIDENAPHTKSALYIGKPRPISTKFDCFAFYPHMPIYRLLFVCNFVCVCTVADFSGEDKASGVKFWRAVHRRSRQGIVYFWGTLLSSQKPKVGRIGQRVKDDECSGW